MSATVDSPWGVQRMGESMTRDERAREVWAVHYGPLSGWVLALVGDREVAHDIVSEAFTRLLSRWKTVRDPKPFLFAVAGNLARDHWRSSQRDARLLERAGRLTRESTSPEDPWLRDLVERLPDKQRMPVLLHYYADLPVADVARALKRPEGSVKRELSEARAALLVALKESS